MTGSEELDSQSSASSGNVVFHGQWSGVRDEDSS